MGEGILYFPSYTKGGDRVSDAFAMIEKSRRLVRFLLGGLDLEELLAFSLVNSGIVQHPDIYSFIPQ